MALRKPTNDPEATVGAVDLFATFIAANIGEAVTGSDELGETLVTLFRTAEFETTTAKVAGETVTMRRLVLTGQWEIIDTE